MLFSHFSLVLNNPLVVFCSIVCVVINNTKTRSAFGSCKMVNLLGLLLLSVTIIHLTVIKIKHLKKDLKEFETSTPQYFPVALT